MADSMEEFRKIYERLVDDELLELAAAPDSLTPEARTALSKELEHRGLADEAMEAAASQDAAPEPPITSGASVGNAAWSVVPESQTVEAGSGWVAVSSAESEAEARQTQEILKAAGIESQLQIVVLIDPADANRAFDVLSERLDREQES